MKRCTKCGVEQPFADFYAAKGTRDGLRGDCKNCFKERAAARYRANPERAKERARAWVLANPERARETRRRRRNRPEVKARERATYLSRKFGLTFGEYERMLAEQGGRCAICKRRPTKGISLHVDHEHRTKRVRGLLCFRCNNALGDFGDRADLLVNALDYLTPPPTGATRRRIEALASR